MEKKKIDKIASVLIGFLCIIGFCIRFLLPSDNLDSGSPNIKNEKEKENGYTVFEGSKKYYKEDGYDYNGYDRNGYDKAGYDEEGYNKNGYSRDGYDKNGVNEKGESYIELYKNTKTSSLYEIFSYTEECESQFKRKDQFETDDEYLKREEFIKNKLRKIFIVETEGKYDVHSNSWKISGIPLTINDNKTNSYYFYVCSPKFDYQIPMEIKQAKLMQTMKVQILCSPETGYSDKILNEENIIGVKSARRDKSATDGKPMKTLRLKDLAIIVWDKNKKNVLFFKKL